MRRTINISVINTPVGIPVSSDGVMMIVVKAVAVANTFVLENAYLLSKLADAATLGITPAYDTTNSLAVYQQISEFYEQAGDGALLWVVGIATTTTFTNYVATGTTFDTLVRFTAQKDFTQRCKMIGFCYDVPTTTQTGADFPADVTAAILAIQVAQKRLFNLGYQWSAIIDGYNMSTAVTPSTLGTRAQDSCPSVSCCITGTRGNGVSAVGLALGRFARISIGHGFGEVADGPVDTSTAFLTNSIFKTAGGSALVVGTTILVAGAATDTVTYNTVVYTPGQQFVVVTGHTVFTATGTGYGIQINQYSQIQSEDPNDINVLGDKQYMFLRTWIEHNGFYWNDGATCDNPVDQLSSQEFNRVANALSADALAFFIGPMGSNLPLDTKTGNVSQGWLNANQQQFYDQYINPLSTNGGSGDISDGELVVTGPNFNSTRALQFTLTISPTPILGEVDGKVVFSAILP